MREAAFYEKYAEGKVRCSLCPHRCIIAPGKVGVCQVRRNESGILQALTYGKTTSVALDPIEKKPLYHFHPGTKILSLGPNGCNFQCEFCQNWHISQSRVTTQEISPDDLLRLCRENDAIGIAYTYAEPMIWYEFVLDASRIARSHGLVNVLVTNGFINPEPLQELLPSIDALNIDIKSMDDEFYKKFCHGWLQPVLDTVAMASKQCHVEITNLVIPGLNDRPDNFERLAKWLAGISSDIPLHFSRYFPHYQLHVETTPSATLKMAREIASRFLRHVFLGNVNDQEAGSTWCPRCKSQVISRDGYRISYRGLHEGKCRHCGLDLPIITK